MIPVTKPYLPPREKINAYLDKIYETGWLTNRGPLVCELETRLKKYLGVEHLVLVANGSLALQVAFKALELKGDVLTSPFSFAATASTLVWEGLKPRFVDIDKKSFNLDPGKLKDQLTNETSAIVPVHVFGTPCDVESIGSFAKEHNLKVVYDAAHAFGVNYKNQSVLNYGDISTLSFHATKIFQTIEGGAVITANAELEQKVRLLINFGIDGPDSISALGTNAKMNEFEAAMGLCVLDHFEKISLKRREIWKTYQGKLSGHVHFQTVSEDVRENYSYAPILLKNEQELKNVVQALSKEEIVPRRYFYPSLDSVRSYKAHDVCENSRDIASRILCLPSFDELKLDEVERICEIIKRNLL